MSNDKPKTNLATLPLSASLNPEQAINAALQKNFKEVLICGFDNDGKFVSLNSKMSRRDALWIIENEREYSLFGDSLSDQGIGG